MSSHLTDETQKSDEHHTVRPVVSCRTVSDFCHALPLNLLVNPEGIGLRRSSMLPRLCNNMNEVTHTNHTRPAKQPEIYRIGVRNSVSFSSSSKRMVTHNSGLEFFPPAVPASSAAGISLSGNVPLNPFSPHKVVEFPVGLFMDSNDVQHADEEVNTWEGLSPVAVNIPHLCLGSNQSARPQDLAFTSLPQRPSPSVHRRAGLFNMRDFITYSRNKRPHLGVATGDIDAMNAHKRPKISSCQPEKSEKPHKRELLLFKDVEGSFPVSEISFYSKGKNQPDLDLDLHL